MQTRDHKVLAEFLVTEMERQLSVVHIKAFIWGNIEPDKNPFTYLHGLTKGEKFHGHNYENVLPVMEKLFDSLEGKRNWGIREYYHLGKLMHYVADSFTFPHNRTFEGDLREHCRYEKELHESFLSILPEWPKQSIQKRKGKGLEDIKKLHKEYLQQAGSYENDCRYILRAAAMVAGEEMENLWKVNFTRLERV